MTIFRPPLATVTEISIPEGRQLYAHLRFCASLETPDTDGIWQVWTNAGGDGSQWRAVDFTHGPIPQKRDEDIVLESAAASACVMEANIDVPATTPLEISYTFRKAFPDGRIEWCGDGGSNGFIRFTEGREGIEENYSSVSEAHKALQWSGVVVTPGDKIAPLQKAPTEAKVLLASAPIDDFVVLTSGEAPDRTAHLLIQGDNFMVSTANLFEIDSTGRDIFFRPSGNLYDIATKCVSRASPFEVLPAGSGIALRSPFDSSLSVYRPSGLGEWFALPSFDHDTLLLEDGKEASRIFKTGTAATFSLGPGHIVSTFREIPLVGLKEGILVAVLNARSIDLDQPDSRRETSINPLTRSSQTRPAEEDPQFTVFGFISHLFLYLWLVLSQSIPPQNKQIQSTQQDDASSVTSDPSDDLRTPTDNLSPRLISVRSLTDVNPASDSEEDNTKHLVPPRISRCHFVCTDLSVLYIGSSAKLGHLKLYTKNQEQEVWDSAGFDAQPAGEMTRLNLEGGTCMLRIEYSE